MFFRSFKRVFSAVPGVFPKRRSLFISAFFALMFFSLCAENTESQQETVIQPSTVAESDSDQPADLPVDVEENVERRSQLPISETKPRSGAEVLPLPEDIESGSGSAWMARGTVMMKGLDKVTARVFSTRVPVNKKVRFGTLEIYVRKVFERPPEEEPEQVAFIEIYDTPPGKKQDLIFSGWMFASSPAISALEHPIYDIWIE